jgi:hypothetical protein
MATGEIVLTFARPYRIRKKATGVVTSNTAVLRGGVSVAIRPHSDFANNKNANITEMLRFSGQNVYLLWLAPTCRGAAFRQLCRPTQA